MKQDLIKNYLTVLILLPYLQTFSLLFPYISYRSRLMCENGASLVTILTLLCIGSGSI